VTIIEFDVVLTGSSAKYGQGKIGVCMAVLEGDTGKKSDASKSEQTRIRFNIPLTLPDFG